MRAPFARRTGSYSIRPRMNVPRGRLALPRGRSLGRARSRGLHPGDHVRRAKGSIFRLRELSVPDHAQCEFDIVHAEKIHSLLSCERTAPPSLFWSLVCHGLSLSRQPERSSPLRIVLALQSKRRHRSRISSFNGEILAENSAENLSAP